MIPGAKGLSLFFTEDGLTTEFPALEAPLNRSITPILTLVPALSISHPNFPPGVPHHLPSALYPSVCSNTTQRTPDTPIGCPVTWGTWTAPGDFKPVQPQSAYTRNAALSLWLRSTEDVVLKSFEVELHKGPPWLRCVHSTATCLFRWNYEATDFSYEDGPAVPLLRIPKNESVPLTMMSGLLNPAAATTKAGDVFTLRFLINEIVGSNLTGLQLFVEFGSASRPSGISLLVSPSSYYYNSDALGLYVNDGEILTDAPPTEGGSKARGLRWTPEGVAVTIGRAVADDTYTLLGNAEVRLWTLVKPTHTIPTSGTTRIAHGPQLQFNLAVRLVIGDVNVTSNFGSMRCRVLKVPTTGASCYHDSDLLRSTGAPETPDLPSSHALATAGLVIPEGAEVRLELVLKGVNDPELSQFLFFYGTANQPSGLTVPANAGEFALVGGVCGPPLTPPSKQTLAATPGSAQVGLSWSSSIIEPCAAITSYHIRRATAEEPTPRFLVEVEGASAYLDVGLTNDEPYYYQVAAVNAIGVGDLSDQVASVPKHTAPNLGNLPGVSNGNLSLYSDRLTLRVAAGSTKSFIISLHNQGGTDIEWVLELSGVSRGLAAAPEEASGVVERYSSIATRLHVSLGSSARLGTSFNLGVGATTPGAVVGPLELNVLASEEAGADGEPLSTAPRPNSRPASDEPGTPPIGVKAISEPAGASGAGLFLVLGCLVGLGFALGRRRRPPGQPRSE